MKTSLIAALKAHDHATVFQMFKVAANHLLLHDTLLEECTVEECYFYVKAVKLVAPFELFKEFASNTIGSQYGGKQIFHHILTMYEVPPYDLKFNHLEKDGIQPELTRYCDIARTVF